MNFEKDLVSVCIPTYNGAEHIRQTIESVLSQSYNNIEIIVNDDGSTDNTLQIVQSIDDSRIFVYKNENNRGLPGNWNEAVKRAKGEYIKLLCQDDLLFPDSLRLQVEAMKNTDISCVIGNSTVINGDGKTVMKRNRFKKNEVVSGIKFAKRSLIGRNIYSEPPNLLYRTEAFYKYGGYDESLKYTPDWDFALGISLDGRICCLSQNIMSFRISETSETSRMSRERMKFLINDTDRFFDKHKKSNLLKLSLINEIEFKIVIRLIAFIRFLVVVTSK